MKKMVNVRPEMQHVLDKLGDVPVDIAPRPITAIELIATAERAAK